MQSSANEKPSTANHSQTVSSGLTNHRLLWFCWRQ